MKIVDEKLDINWAKMDHEISDKQGQDSTKSNKSTIPFKVLLSAKTDDHEKRPSHSFSNNNKQILCEIQRNFVHISWFSRPTASARKSYNGKFATM